MNDRELVELAAKAAGYDVERWNNIEEFLIVCPSNGPINFTEWNPLTDDGDAFRLAVKLNIHVLRFESMTTARPLFAEWGCDERDDGDATAATRRAIVRAAAEIGKKIDAPLVRAD